MEHSDRFLEGKMGATIDEIIDSLKRGQGKRVSDLVKMALEEGTRLLRKAPGRTRRGLRSGFRGRRRRNIQRFKKIINVLFLQKKRISL